MLLLIRSILTFLRLKNRKFIGGIFILYFTVSCTATKPNEAVAAEKPVSESKVLLPGAYNTKEYFPLFEGRRVGVVANPTSMIEDTHLVDTLLSAGVDVVRVFAPEHGFRGNIGAGDVVHDDVDAKTSLPIISLYGNNKKPKPQFITDLDVIVFDIQDVGVRFYTYLSTLHYVMEAAAENNVEVIVLDRPNPNIRYVDGPVMQEEYFSFIGMHPVPLVYGMSIGEYALMINGESWLKNEIKVELKIIRCTNYTRSSIYTLPVKPSPNLPVMESIYLYPGLGLFEGTRVSVGRGTELPFTRIGQPDNTAGDFTFTPVSVPGAAPQPLHQGKLCRGYNLIGEVSVEKPPTTLPLEYILRMYRESGDKEGFFIQNNFFEKLAGNGNLRRQIVEQLPESEIRETWKEELNDFMQIRSIYLLYPQN